MLVDRNWGEPRILPPTGSHEMDPADVQSFVEGDLPTEASLYRFPDWKTRAVVKEWKVESEDLDALIASIEQGTERQDLGALIASTGRERAEEAEARYKRVCTYYLEWFDKAVELLKERNEAARLVLQFEKFVAGLKGERDENYQRMWELTLDLAKALQDATYHKDRAALEAARHSERERDNG